MSFIKINIKGFSPTLSKLGQMEDTQRLLVPTFENSYRRYQMEAFKNAPVLTGRLSSNLVDDRFTFKKYSKDKLSISQRQGTYSYGEHYGAYYLLLQEYSNPTKSRFVRNSLNKEYPKLMKDMLRLYEREMKM